MELSITAADKSRAQQAAAAPEGAKTAASGADPGKASHLGVDLQEVRQLMASLAQSQGRVPKPLADRQQILSRYLDSVEKREARAAKDPAAAAAGRQLSSLITRIVGKYPDVNRELSTALNREELSTQSGDKLAAEMSRNLANLPKLLQGESPTGKALLEFIAQAAVAKLDEKQLSDNWKRQIADSHLSVIRDSTPREQQEVSRVLSDSVKFVYRNQSGDLKANSGASLMSALAGARGASPLPQSAGSGSLAGIAPRSGEMTYLNMFSQTTPVRDGQAVSPDLLQKINNIIIKAAQLAIESNLIDPPSETLNRIIEEEDFSLQDLKFVSSLISRAAQGGNGPVMSKNELMGAAQGSMTARTLSSAAQELSEGELSAEIRRHMDTIHSSSDIRTIEESLQKINELNRRLADLRARNVIAEATRPQGRTAGTGAPETGAQPGSATAQQPGAAGTQMPASGAQGAAGTPLPGSTAQPATLSPESAAKPLTAETATPRATDGTSVTAPGSAKETAASGREAQPQKEAGARSPAGSGAAPGTDATTGSPAAPASATTAAARTLADQPVPGSAAGTAGQTPSAPGAAGTASSQASRATPGSQSTLPQITGQTGSGSAALAADQPSVSPAPSRQAQAGTAPAPVQTAPSPESAPRQAPQQGSAGSSSPTPAAVQQIPSRQSADQEAQQTAQIRQFPPDPRIPEPARTNVPLSSQPPVRSAPENPAATAGQQRALSTPASGEKAPADQPAEQTRVPAGRESAEKLSFFRRITRFFNPSGSHRAPPSLSPAEAADRGAVKEARLPDPRTLPESPAPQEAPIPRGIRQFRNIQNAVPGQTLPVTAQSTGLSALLGDLSSEHLAPEFHAAAKHIESIFSQSLASTPAIMQWLSYVDSPVSGSSSFSKGLRAWATMLVTLRMKQFGIDAGSVKNPRIHDLQHWQSQAPIDDSEQWPQNFLQHLADHADKLHQNQQQRNDPLWANYIPLPTPQDNQRENGMSFRRSRREDQTDSIELQFYFEIKSLGPVGIHVTYASPDISVKATAETYEGYSKIRETLPLLEKRFTELSLNCQDFGCTKGTVRHPLSQGKGDEGTSQADSDSGLNLRI